MTIGSNDVRSNDLGSNNIGSNDKLSKRRQRVELKKLYVLFQGWVRLRQFVGRTLRLGGRAMRLVVQNSNKYNR